ncbi:hypothetical protein KY319_03370 [Candidatus Woesearchaeota archaeon]|nr:hypothetical protein [Candidatus Woesearchaeota archaeon]
MATDFAPFKKLAPERRIQELQKLIDNLRKQATQIQDEIKEAEHLLILADDEARVLEHMEVPEIKEIKKGKPEAKPAKKRMADLELEELLETGPRTPELLHEVAHRPVHELYQELRSIYDRQKETGIETRQDREMLYAIRKGFEIKKEEGYKPAPTEKHLMTAAEEWAEQMYQGTAGTYKRTPG